MTMQKEMEGICSGFLQHSPGVEAEKTGMTRELEMCSTSTGGEKRQRYAGEKK